MSKGCKQLGREISAGTTLPVWARWSGAGHHQSPPSSWGSGPPAAWRGGCTHQAPNSTAERKKDISVQRDQQHSSVLLLQVWGQHSPAAWAVQHTGGFSSLVLGTPLLSGWPYPAGCPSSLLLEEQKDCWYEVYIFLIGKYNRSCVTVHVPEPHRLSRPLSWYLKCH